MRIAIDARAYQWTGIGRYTRGLLDQYARIGTSHEFVVMVPRGEIDEARHVLDLPSENFSFVGVEPSYYSWREQVFFCMQAMRVDADLFHFTHFNVPLFFRKPYVVTIHDTTRFLFPGQKRQKLIQQIGYEVVFSHALARAKAAICVSSATRRELGGLPLSLPPVAETIHEGVDEMFLRDIGRDVRQKVRMLLGTQNRYLLYVGIWMSHKNLIRLLSAFEIVRRSHPDLKLCITGKPVPGYSRLMQNVREMGMGDSVIFPGFVPHELLPALYAEATSFVFPSLYEGFGLPPLEAAACGCPVVASNGSSIPEIMGDSAEYVNPESVVDIARGIERVLAGGAYVDALVHSGRERVRHFQWDACAEKTLALYESVT